MYKGGAGWAWRQGRGRPLTLALVHRTTGCRATPHGSAADPPADTRHGVDRCLADAPISGAEAGGNSAGAGLVR